MSPSFSIGRMYHCSSLTGERFYLHLLLTTVRGPWSFDDLKIVIGYWYPTFREVCIALDLLQGDREWIMYFMEIAAHQTAKPLRDLLVTVLLVNAVTDLTAIWMQFRQYFCDD